jgi:Fe-S-cluster containining protein
MFPELVRPILPPLFDELAPNEEKATCGSCAMCRPEGAPPAGDVVYFRPDVKCCSYFPKLPNYLVGAILRDERPDMAEGRRRIREKIATRIGVTPRWLAPPRKISVLLEASRRAAFGRSLVLRCPYYEPQGGLCTIWRHREADCSTFFCKYVAGADGQRFWKTLDTYLRYVESKLSAYATSGIAPHLVEPGVPRGEMTLEDLEDRPPAAYADIWREWAGREEELYIACHDRIAALSRDEFERFLGGDAGYAGNLDALGETYRRMNAPVLPERLVLGPDVVAERVEGGVLVSTYSRYEPLLLSPDLYEVLKEFGAGETVAEVKERLLREAGVEVPDAMLIALHQMRVIVAP